MLSFLSYQFIQYAIIISLLIAVSAALISPFLVLNEQALIADGLAHVSFTGLAIGLILSNQPLLISIPFVIIASILIKYLVNNKNINGDAALGILSTVSLAVGLIIIHKSSGFNRSVEGMLLGNLWTVTTSEIIFSIIIFVLILVFVLLFYNKLLLVTFDLKYASFLKVKTNYLSYILSVLTAVLIAIGVKTIGTLLISSFVIFPVLIGSSYNKGFKKTFIIGIVSSVTTVLTGIFIAHFIDIPAGSSIVLVYTIILILSYIFNIIFKKGSGYRD